MQLTQLEEIELKYLKAKGFKYIARHEIGTVEAFKEKPVRSKSTGYSIWVIGRLPVLDFSLYFKTDLGAYDFLKWEDGPLEIDKLLMENGWDIPLVEPKGNEL